MRIIVHDTASALLDLFRRPVDERRDALRDILKPLQDIMPPGLDLVSQHEVSGFRLDRDDPRYPEAVETLRAADVWHHIESTLEAARERLADAVPDAATADQVHVVLTLGNPDDDLFMVKNQGYLGMGGIPGAIHLAIWPTDVSLAKIRYSAAHELHHNVRYANVVWNPMTVTLGEQVVAEGMAEAFVRELAGEAAMGPWATGLSASELDTAYATITEAIDTAGMHNLPAYVYGDETAKRIGAEPVGLPDFAGYAVGLRIADAHLAATGLTAAHSVTTSAAEVLRNAGVATAG